MKRSNLKQIDRRSRNKIQNYLSLLPKLKSYSQNQVLNYQNICKKKSINYNNTTKHNQDIPIPKGKFESISHNISTEKYKYINKSPNYFKRISRSNQLLIMDQTSINQPIEQYVEQNRKNFDKKALINLINDRKKCNSTNNRKMQTILIEPSIFKKQIFKQQTYNHTQNTSKQHILKYKTQDKNNNIEDLIIMKKIKSNQVKPYFLTKNMAQKSFKSSNQCDSSIKNSINNNSIEFYDTHYSQFQPNKILGVKNSFKAIKHPGNLKLNLNQFY